MPSKKNIFTNIQENEQSIFKDESVFYPDYFPENIVARDNQTKELSYLLKPLLSNKKANNIIIYGPPGTGKTLLSNYVLKQLNEYTNKTKYTYINCIQDNTRFAILSKLINFFEGALPRRGLAIDEVWTRLQELFKKSNFFPIIILDEIDKLSSDDTSALLYDLCRHSEKSKYFTLILITNYKSFILDLDSRTQSSLYLSEIEFPKYNPIDLKLILKERIEYGLIPEAISNDLIGYIAGYAATKAGDARIAIDLLYKSAKESEKHGDLKITKDILLSSSRLVDSIKLSEKVKSLSKDEYEVLCLIGNGVKASEIYNNTKLSERTVRRYLEKLDKLELVDIIKVDGGKGPSRKISLKVDKDLLDY